MLELHGWITVRETYKSFFNEEENIDAAIKLIRDKIDSLAWFEPEIHVMDGAYYLEFTVFANRYNPEIDELFELCKIIGKTADGSYGLIYLYDEGSSTKENRFQAFRIAKGNIKEYDDPFLSPIIPVIKD